MHKKNVEQKKKRKVLSNRAETVNKENEKIEAFILLFIFFLFLGICQIIGMVFNIDPLIFMIMTRTSSSMSIWLLVPAGIVSYASYKVLKKRSYMEVLIGNLKKLKQWLKKYPSLYRIVRFAYRRPILSYFLVWTVYTAVEILLYYVIKI